MSGGDASEKQKGAESHITQVIPQDDGKFCGICSCGQWKTDPMDDYRRAQIAGWAHRQANR